LKETLHHEVFQTKSLENLMDRYVITQTGVLMINNLYRYSLFRSKPKKKKIDGWEHFPYNGTISFYTSINDVWFEFDAVFKMGYLQEITGVKAKWNSKLGKQKIIETYKKTVQKAFAIKYELWGTGWGTLSFKWNKKTFHCIVSYLENPILELFNTTLEMNEYIGKKQSIEKEVELQGETHRHILQLTLIDKQLHISLTKYKAHFGDDIEHTVKQFKRFETRMPYEKFYEALLWCFDEFIINKGITQYKYEWADAEYPLTEHLLLKKQWHEWKGREIPTNIIGMDLDMFLLYSKV
jgi:hypothetical protein